MSDETAWTWWWGEGDHPERYHGDVATRDAAIEDASRALFNYVSKGPHTIMVCEGRPVPLSNDIFTADLLLEQFQDHNQDACGEDGLLRMEVTAEQERELENVLATAFGEWRAKHSIGRAWALETRNEEVLTLQQRTSPTNE